MKVYEAQVFHTVSKSKGLKNWFTVKRFSSRSGAENHLSDEYNNQLTRVRGVDVE